MTEGVYFQVKTPSGVYIRTTKLKIYYDDQGKTLSVWFDDPKKEVVSEEVGDGVILSKDKKGKVIGFEKLYVKFPKKKGTSSFPIELSFPQA